ncbi:MAG: nucleoside hydrolase [Bryobacteraceae bacterium]
MSLLALLAAQAQSVPVIYCTDLFHPHQDPDDHLDIATLFALPELDVRAVLLDQGAKQEKEPGRVPMDQINFIAGRRVPYAIGLAEKLKFPGDPATDQPARYQAAVELFFEVLRQSPRPVEVITAGSVRDVMAAFNRNPELVRAKVARLSVNIGRAALAGGEWNVQLDPQAYRRLLESGLPVDWYPCVPLDSLQSSHWKLKRYQDVFEDAPLPLQSFFIYALNRVDPEEIEPLAAIRMNLRPWRRLIWGREKNMWCTASFLRVAGRKADVFTLVPARVEVDQKGWTTKLEFDAPEPNVHAIRLTDRDQYTKAMTACLRNLFKEFPVKTH